MKKRRACVVVTARPSYSRIKSALRAIEAHPDLELQLIVAGSALLEKYGNVIEIIKKDGFDIDAQVYMVVEGENLTTMAKTTGIGLMELATCFDNLKPEIVVTVADRYETLATTIAASFMNIPVAHVQGGEVTGSIDEKVRHAVTKLSNLHFPATPKAAERIVKMGENEEKVFVVGCCSIDLAAEALNDSPTLFDPFAKYGGVGDRIELSDGYLVVLQHPVTTEYKASQSLIIETLYAVKQLGIPTLWFWPNVDAGADGTSKGIRTFREKEKPTNIHFFRNMEPHDFLKLLYNCRVVVGNSSVAIRESSFLGTPAVNIGTRQEGRERGPNVIDVGYSRDEIVSAILHQVKNRSQIQRSLLYGDGKAGRKIAEVLATVDLGVEKKLTY